MNKIKTTEETSCLSCKARKFSWFQSGNDQQVQQRQQQRSAQYHVDANHYLFREGDYPPVYTLKKGWAICYKDFANGQRQIVHIALAGDLLGYRIAPDMPIDYSVKTITPCMLCAFTKTDVARLLDTDKDVLYNLIALQAKQNTSCRNQLAYIGQTQAKHRMAAFLFDIMQRLQRRGVDIKSAITFPLSRRDIANAIGVSLIHLGRVSVELNRQGIIECCNNILYVKDYNALKVLVERN